MRADIVSVWPYDASHKRALPREYKIENNVEQKMRFGGELPGPGFSAS